MSELDDFLNEEDSKVGDQVKDPDVSHKEAPASLNMKTWVDGYGFLITIRAGATDAQIVELVERMNKLVELAHKGGWKTVWSDTPHSGAPVTQPPQDEDRPEEAFCKIHNKPMTKRTGSWGTFWSCSTKLPDGSWCKSTHNEM